MSNALPFSKVVNLKRKMIDMWFFGCMTIIQCWQETIFSHIIELHLHSFHDAKPFILDICRKEDDRDACRFAVLIDSIWKFRNNVV